LCASHICDIRNAEELTAVIRGAEPELVFHLAAQSLVRAGYKDPLYTYGTNVMGTANVLNALRGLGSVRVAVMVTTDKVYRQADRPTRYIEDDVLGGVDPYSASKAASEMVVDSYRMAYLQEQGVAIGAARAGNVIGGGDWSEDRLIPDAVRAWAAGRALEIRRPDSIRPWQHVLDPLAGYLRLAEQLRKKPALAGAYNFGPEAESTASVKDVIELARRDFVDSEVNFDEGESGPYEASMLMLDIERARSVLGIIPRWQLSEAIKRTTHWYVEQMSGRDARELCSDDFRAYESQV